MFASLFTIVVPQEINFDREKGTLLLSIKDGDIDVPEYVKEYAHEKELYEKRELHITIFGFSVGQKIIRKLEDMEYTERQAFLDDIAGMAREKEWNFTPKKEFYHLKKQYTPKDKPKEHRESVVMMVDLSFSDFISKVNKILNLTLEVPPPHITLYSTSDYLDNLQAGIGVGSEEELRKFKYKEIFEPVEQQVVYKAIALPTRAQPDTIIAIFILKQFGESYFPGIGSASCIILPRIAEDESESTLGEEGVLLVDVGKGRFDHHSKSVKTTASLLVADYLGVKDNAALSRLLQFAERDDFYGKGIISNDPLDRAFGFSGLVGSLNKKYVNDPGRVVEIALPFIDAFYTEESKRAFEMPQELKEKREQGKAYEFSVRQRGKVLNCILIDTDNTSMAGFLRSKGGGGFDVVALHLSSGHINILTRPIQAVDLRSLAVLIRLQEAEAKKSILHGDPNSLSIPGVLPEVPEWYYDPATNSILNGGPNPGELPPTKIDAFEFRKILELGLSEKLWAPSK